MKNIKWKPILNCAGFATGIIGVIFVANKLLEYSDKIDFSSLSFLALAQLLGMSFAYGCANILLSIAWRDILFHFGVKVKLNWAIQTYGISQVAKYVPGNIFQFAGRQAIGQAANLPGKALIKSSFWEIGLLAFTGFFFTILVIPLFWHKIASHIALAVFLIILTIVNFCLSTWVGKSIASAMKWYVLFFIIAGLIFYGVLNTVQSIMPETQFIFTNIVGAYVVALVAGLLTPGTPAGIGVREFIFLSVLHSTIPDSELLMAIVLGRIVTVCGDVFFYVFSIVLGLRKKLQSRFSEC